MTEINTMLGNVSFNKYTQYFKDKEIAKNVIEKMMPRISQIDTISNKEQKI